MEKLKKNEATPYSIPHSDCRNTHWNGIHAVTVNQCTTYRQTASNCCRPFMPLKHCKQFVMSSHNRHEAKGEANEMYSVALLPILLCELKLHSKIYFSVTRDLMFLLALKVTNMLLKITQSSLIIFKWTGRHLFQTDQKMNTTFTSV